MTELTTEQLQAITDEIHALLGEFELPSAALPTRGMVRLMWGVFCAHQQQPPMVAATPTHPAAQPRKPLPDPDVARDRLAAALAQGSGDSLLALELRTQRTLEEVDPDPDAQKRAEFDAVVKELQRVAMAGIMPRMTTWDAIKPLHLPTSKTIINVYRMGWRQLAEVADLKMDRKGGAEMEPVHRNGVA